MRDNRGREASANKYSEEKMALMRDHINSIPKYKSHYSRWESSKYYLPAHLNLTLVYEKHLERTDDPKCGFLNTTIKEETDLLRKEDLQKQLASHHKDADFAYEQKMTDKNLAKTNSVNTRYYMFDLQQCLPTPCLIKSVVFYYRQLRTFTLTMYDSTNSRTRCYMCHEAEDARGGNKIATCIYKQLVSLPPDVEHVILYSDTCGGQNKNSHVSAMFLTAIQNIQHLKTVDHKFMNTLSDEEPFKELSLVRRGAAKTTIEPKKCYTEQLPIPKKNKNDFISILVPLHHFYLGLESSLKIPDVLPDIEEFTNEH
ncbi:hypothetical protein PR048_028348 [Dryococelus australis]|uniref:Uncharacterized protein n=1 Tax=Dryococelus australis TaxID=614101 RepID=A0ABQ9GJ10_9NEOP|nr:hypothetical protein PR048_028348 [Dryococelus australis]